MSSGISSTNTTFSEKIIFEQHKIQFIKQINITFLTTVLTKSIGVFVLSTYVFTNLVQLLEILLTPQQINQYLMDSRFDL